MIPLAEAIAAGVVGAALLWLVIQPMVIPVLSPPDDLDLPDPEETPRGQALLALREIEFDRATGKLSDADFTLLHARYSTAAIATLDAPVSPAASDAIEAMIASRAATLRLTAHDAQTGAVRCLVHGERREAEARFCPDCGLGLVTDTGACVACDTAIRSDALFCAGCGVRVRS